MNLRFRKFGFCLAFAAAFLLFAATSFHYHDHSSHDEHHDEGSCVACRIVSSSDSFITSPQISTAAPYLNYSEVIFNKNFFVYLKKLNQSFAPRAPPSA